MSVVVIPVSQATGTLDVTIASPDYPQALAGILWRYNADETPDGKAGSFTPSSPRAQFGNPMSNDGKYLYIEGVVLHHDDNPPTPYEVVVTVSHNGTPIHADVPTDHGTGTVGSADVAFNYLFQIKVLA